MNAVYVASSVLVLVVTVPLFSLCLIGVCRAAAEMVRGR